MPYPASHVTDPLYSSEFLQLEQLLLSLKKPYGTTEIGQFNRLYSSIYPNLTPHEKQLAEVWVDDLVKHVVRPELAATIFGVV